MTGSAHKPKRFSPWRIAAFLAAFLLTVSPAVGSGESFTYVDLHPAGWISSASRCVNDGGEVVGYGMTPDGERGFAWSADTFRELLPPGADSARALWVNGRGDIAGTGVAGDVPHAFLLRDGVYLDPTPGWGWSEATYVGSDGSVGGHGEFGAYISRDGIVEIFPGFSFVTGGNSSGQWVGSSGSSSVLYLPGQGYQDVTPPGATSSIPHGINESGLVAGDALRSGTMKGYVKSGEFYIDLNPSGWFSSRATAINDLNEVVGYGESASGMRSFLRSGGTTEEIAFPGWTTTEAASLNNAGQVAGSGTTADGQTRAFLASPAGMTAPGESVSTPGPGSAGGCSLAQAPGTRRSDSVPAAIAFWILPLFLMRRRGGWNR